MSLEKSPLAGKVKEDLVGAVRLDPGGRAREGRTGTAKTRSLVK